MMLPNKAAHKFFDRSIDKCFHGDDNLTILNLLQRFWDIGTS